MSHIEITRHCAAPGIRKLVDVQQEAILQVVYRSDHSSTMGPAHIEEFGGSAKRRNDALGLTGFLLSQGDVFIGVLEGPSSVVIERLEEISNDRRHERMSVLREAPIATQRFRDWYFGNLTKDFDYPGASADGRMFADILSRRLRLT